MADTKEIAALRATFEGHAARKFGWGRFERDSAGDYLNPTVTGAWYWLRLGFATGSGAGVPPVSQAPHPLDALLPEICQLIDGCKADWERQGCWSAWDQSVRDRITAYNLSRASSSGIGGVASGSIVASKPVTGTPE